MVEIFLSCEKFEKFDYQTFWSRFPLGQPEKFDFQTFRRKSQKFAQKVKSLKIKLFSQKSLIFKLFDKNLKKSLKKLKVWKSNFFVKKVWKSNFLAKKFKFLKKFDFQTFWSKKVWKVWKSNFSNFFGKIVSLRKVWKAFEKFEK